MRDFIEQLARDGELRTVTREVDPRHELAAVTWAAQQGDDSALLFKKVKGTDFPVVTNLYTSRRRLCNFIGSAEDGFCQTWNGILEQTASAKTAATTTIDRPADLITGKLSDLPLITYHEKDAGPYFTSAIYISRDPDTGVGNLSFHRSMFVSDNELRIRLGYTHDMADYQRRAEEKNEALPVALLIGVRPEVFLGACTSIPKEQDELQLAAVLAGKPTETWPAQTSDLHIPAGTQCVVEGRILPTERRPEGPFGEFMGYYVAEGENHVFAVDAVYWQPGAVFHSLLCGSREDLSPLEAVTAARVYHFLNNRLPGIIDVSCAPAFLNTTVKIKKEYDNHPAEVIQAAIESNQDYNKAVFVVDEDVDIHNMNEVMWSFLTRGRADTRTTVIRDKPGFYRDPHRDHWGRLGLDCTRPLGREHDFDRKGVPGAEKINLDDYFD